MKPVKFHPEARLELRAAVRYYESQQRGLGKRLKAAAQEATQRIQAFPVQFRTVDADVRQCRVLRFPYGLLYRVRHDHIEVVAFMHLRRRPGYWKERIGHDQ